MAEPAYSNISGAVSRFYAVQRTEGTTAALSVDPVQQLSVAHDNPSPVSDTMEAALEAFMNSPEEDAVSFVEGFLHLTSGDRVTALAKLENHGEPSPDGNAVAGNPLWEATIPAATRAELQGRLRRHEAQAHQLALAESHTGDEQRSNNDCRPLQDGMPAEAATGGSSVTWNGDVEGLETIEWAEGTRTGVLIAFMDRGVKEVSTHFDNFFDTDASPNTPFASAQNEEWASVPPPSVTGILPTLDKILGLDTEEGEDATTPPSRKACLLQTADATDSGALLNELEQQAHSRSESNSSSLTSSVESVALPGLEDICVDSEATRKSSGGIEHIDVFAQLHEVIAECDNCVQPFTLDPLFDYDAEILGETFLSGAAWRQEDGSRGTPPTLVSEWHTCRPVELTSGWSPSDEE
ncbi:hypothetical protein, conserved [Leishmania tarentolae]|uniref:Uncharacterized protein n=1 Tax=Leishmania tarentolae TaxID=5689 RepID=A0A640KXG6_LEITA|nr:hypothetical protein, conserved [Leishmania tarentolae]